MQALPVAELTRRIRTPVDLGQAIGRLRRGAGDPTHRRASDGWWRASRTPEGPALLRLHREGEAILARAWGSGADWVLEQVPELLGLHDDAAGFEPRHPLLVDLARRNPWLRIGRTRAVLEAFAPTVIEQKVTGREAFGAFRRLVRRFGEPAPGPARDPASPAYGMCVQPDGAGWAAIPSWEWLRAMVDGKRSTALVRGARRAAALERTLESADVDAALRSLPGVGAWTSAEVRAVAHGDPDAWSIGDYHVPRMIIFALTGEDRTSDEVATELLEPWRGHRLRVQLLIMSAGLGPERRGPRRSLPTHLPR